MILSVYKLVSLVDSSVKLSISMASVCKYSVWEGAMLKDCELVKDDDTPPSSLLLLWLSDTHARQLHKDLSVIQPEARPGHIYALSVPRFYMM